METSVKQNLAVRIKIFVLLLISLIIMTSTKTTDVVRTTGDYNQVEILNYSFKDFSAFRFVVAANLLGCLYSFIMIIQGVRGTTTPSYLVLSFSLDQIMAYIILSSASAGIACIILTRDFFQVEGLYNGAEKKFLRNASISVSIELLGFLSMAGCAATSKYNYNYLFKTTNAGSTQETPAINVDNKEQTAV